MAGVVLETLSNRKLGILATVLFLVQLIFFLIGGLVAPAPSNVHIVTGRKCLDEGHHRHKSAWFYPRGDGSCRVVDSLDDPIIEKNNITANQIVFAFQFPLIRDNTELDMSRWFQNLISVLQLDIDYSEQNKQIKRPVITMDARLGYRDKTDGPSNWTEIAKSTELRTLHCVVDKEEENYPLHCDLLPFFELGSCHYDFYLVNIRLPVHEITGTNMNIGKLKDITMVGIHQNGGFTKVWFSIKTLVFPAVLAALIWFWNRVSQLDRSPHLLEKTLLCLGITISFLNLPVEWLTLWIHMPFMLLFSDVRQGIFYAMLLCFWIIFAGEHMMDAVERNRLTHYWKHLGAVCAACLCLFIFEMCERGVQLTNPFYSIWVTETGQNLALGFIILACVAACLYFFLLCYMIGRVFINISAKKSALPHMNKSRRKYYSGLIFRFKFLMVTTLIYAAVTVIFFIISQVSEGHWKWGEDYAPLEYTSAFFTGIYGMWNMYVFCLLSLYAPSHKYKALNTDENDDSGEVVEFSNLTSEATGLTSFVTKPSTD